MNPWKVAAELLVAVHAAFVAFVVFGGLAAWRWPRLAWLHVPALVWGAAVELTGWICPLTPLERAARRAAGEVGYRGGFIAHYLLPLLYPAGLDRAEQLFLGALVLGWNLLLYGLLWRRSRR